MKLNFLGNGSAFNPLYGNTCAYFVYEKELYLLDCGETAFSLLYQQVDLDKIEKVYVIVTHLHADHVGSLGTLISYFYCLYGIRIYVIHPEKVLEQFLAGKIDAIYQDTSTHESPHSNHCYYGKLENKIPAEKRGKVFCMHLDGPCEEIVRAKGFQIVEVCI